MESCQTVVRRNEEGTSDVSVLEAFPITYERASHLSCITSVKRELDVILSREVLKLFEPSNFPPNAKILGGHTKRCVQTWDVLQEVGAHFFVQGHLDAEKSVLIHYSVTLRQTSVRLILSLMSACDQKVWSGDIKQAYKRSHPPIRLVFFTSVPDFGVREGLLLHIMRPLHRLADVGDAWWRTLRTFRTNEVRLTQTLGEPLILYQKNTPHPSLFGVYVDDFVFYSGLRCVTSPIQYRRGSPASRLAMSPSFFLGAKLGGTEKYSPWDNKTTAVPWTCYHWPHR